MNSPRFLAVVIWDVRYALRVMRQHPVFALSAIFILALAIGGNAAMFTVIETVLLKPLPYPDSDRLVRISGGATPTRFSEIKATAKSFSGVGAFANEETPTLAAGDEPEVVKAVRISANFLKILQVEPLRGRVFREQEDTAAGTPVAMISAALWDRRFDADANVIGKTATLAGTAYTIIGVLPRRFAFPYPDLDVWMTAPQESPLFAPKSRALSPYLTVFGRLEPGVTLAQASAEAKIILRQYARAHPTMLDAKPRRPLKITRLKDEMITDVRSMLWMLLGAVGFVLLIACANVASLLLARAHSRSREIAVRSALGAGRIRLIVQFVSESVVLSVLGGALGLLLAAWLLRLIPGMTAFNLPRSQEIALDWRVLGFAAAISVSTGLLFGLVPAIGASRPDVDPVLRMSGAAASGGSNRGVLGRWNARGLLLVTQIVLSIVLLVGTSLLIETVSRMRAVAIGFNPANVLTAGVSLPPARYGKNEKRVLFFDDLLRGLANQPGVTSAAASMTVPMMMGYPGTPVQDAAKPLLKLNERPIATLGVITPGYFRTLEIPLRRGRDFTDRDKEGAQRVAIIDEALARRFWPAYPHGLDPIGQHIWVGGVNPNPAEIVGIVGDVHQSVENSGWHETVYVAFAQTPPPFAMLSLRTAANPLVFATAVRNIVRKLDPSQSVSEVRTMDGLIDDQIGQRRLLVILLGSFAGMALLLVLMGLYGLIASLVVDRTKEIGIRRALGADRSDILTLVMRESLGLVLLGIIGGVGAALLLTRLMQSLLFNIKATDPGVYTAVVLLFLPVAVLASYLPARRATRIDPAATLRI